MTEALQSLSEFTVRVDYGRKHTSFDVHDHGRGKPVVRMHMDRPYHVLDKLLVFPVAAPERPLGHVAAGAAATPDNVLVGRCRGVFARSEEQVIEQVGFGELIGRPTGLSKVVGAESGVPGLDYLASFRMAFRSPDGATAFTFRRSSGLRTEYKVTVEDDRVSRLLVLAWVEHFNRGNSSDVRQDLIDFTTNPFQKPGPEIQAARERRKAAIQAAKQNRGHGTDPR